MDHAARGAASSTMAMTMSGTGTAAAASATATKMSMGGMGSGCKISMLWNWNTVDACFISSSWKITSNGVFAGSCIGVILLVICLEFLRRAGKEYDRYILRQFLSTITPAPITPHYPAAGSSEDNSKDGTAVAVQPTPTRAPAVFRPNLLQQAIRALIHMCAFAVAYFIMLLAMYYNGYLIICIFIGAYLGFFIFGWENVTVE